jgi:hypothetical protein
MTDRVKGFTVTLAEDVRIDDIEPTMQAIRMIKGVVDVQPSIADGNDHINRMQVLHNIREKFIKFLDEEL